MSTTNQTPIGHSSVIHIQLSVNGMILPVGQLGLNFLVLEHPVDHPPIDAEISMSIDGREERWRVNLPDGIQMGKVKTAIAKA
jgi:hypothetical protein